MVTTMDSAAYSLSASLTYDLKEEDPGRYLRLFWAVMLAVVRSASSMRVNIGKEACRRRTPGHPAILAIPISATMIASMHWR